MNQDLGALVVEMIKLQESGDAEAQENAAARLIAELVRRGRLTDEEAGEAWAEVWSDNHVIIEPLAMAVHQDGSIYNL